MVLPMASAVPKYLSAALSDKTKDSGSEEGGRVAFRQRQLDDLKEIRIHETNPLPKLPVATGERHDGVVKSRHCGHFGNLVVHRSRHPKRHERHCEWIAPLKVGRFLDTVEISRSGNPFVVGLLVPDEQKDEDHGGEPNRHARNIDKALQPVAGDVAEGGDEVVVEHDQPSNDFAGSASAWPHFNQTAICRARET